MSTNSSSNNNNRNRKKRKKTSGKKKFDPAGFWGTPDSVPTPEGFDTSTPDSVAVVNSLGQPPLPGHGAASPHYFKLVYDRSTQLAAALAMAGGIEDLTPEDPPEPEPEPEPDEDEADFEDDELAERSADEMRDPSDPDNESE